ncbi:sphinganine C4-monooxygenase 2-like [Wolffia australiana]
MGFFSKGDLLMTFVPIAVYWVASGVYILLSQVEKYRLRPREEENSKNLVSKGQVVRGVILQQAVQATASLIFCKVFEDPGSKVNAEQSYFAVASQFIVAMVVFDAWQFLMHRLMHWSTFLYRTLHSRHHLLVVPYPYGAQFNHPLDGLIIESMSGGLAYALSGMSQRAAVVFYSLTILKAVDDHCGLYIPWNPIHIIFRNNAAYHDVHHQLAGAKYNHAQSFFTIWDQMCGSYMPYRLEKRADGGYSVVIEKED